MNTDFILALETIRDRLPQPDKHLVDDVYNSLPVSGGAPFTAPADSHAPGDALADVADTGNHSRHWSLPDRNGYPLGDPKLDALEAWES